MTRRIKVALIATALTLGLAAAAGAMVHHQKAGGTLVFAGASDPVVLDGPLVSDGESLRVIDQIFEGLVGLKPGTTQVVPLLATSWKATPNGLNWNFTLRRNVKFQDGTPLNGVPSPTTGTPCSAGSRIRARAARGRTRASSRAAPPRASTPRS